MRSNYRFLIAGLVAFLGFAGGLSMFCIGPIVPLIIADYGVSNTKAGFLTSIVFLVHVVFAIPASTLIGRVGLKTMIALGGLIGSVPMLSFVAADSFNNLLATRAVFGAGFILLFPSVGPLFLQWFNPRELPFINGGFVASVSLGIASSNFLVVPLSEAMGWSVALSVFGGVSMLSTVMWLLLGRVETMPVYKESHRSTIARLREVVRAPVTLLVVAADAGPLALLTAFLGWMPNFYHEVHGMSLTKGGMLMGILSCTGFIALVIASVLPFRFHKRRPFLIFPGVVTGFAAFACIMLPDSPALYAAVVLLGFSCWFYLPTLVTIPMELYSDDPQRIAFIFAALMSIGGIASFVSPPIVGAISDLTGSFVPGLAIFSVMGWSLAISGFLLPETGSNRTE